MAPLTPKTSNESRPPPICWAGMTIARLSPRARIRASSIEATAKGPPGPQSGLALHSCNGAPRSGVRLARKSWPSVGRGTARLRRPRISADSLRHSLHRAGRPSAADATFSQAADIASRFDDRDLASLARHGRGRALIRIGRIAEGVALLDEAMVAVIAGDVAPILAGDIYCSVLEGCRETFDLRRAYDWTTSLAQWCASQQDLVRYRGECLLYRAEVMQLRGNWDHAAQDAQDACGLLTSAADGGRGLLSPGRNPSASGRVHQG